MYYVYAYTNDNHKTVVAYDGKPCGFETSEDAWDFVAKMMDIVDKTIIPEEHPKLAWVKEVRNDILM